MRKIRLVNIILILFTGLVFGQDKKEQSIKNWSYDDLKENYNKVIKKSEKIRYATLYLNKGKKEKSSIRIAKGYYWFALLEYDVDNKKALRLLDSVIKYSKNILDDKFFPAAAYCDKAIFLEKEYQFKGAIQNYNMAEKSAIRNNLDYYYVIRQNIAITKSENLGEVQEALTIYKECYNYYKSKNIRDKNLYDDYQSLIFGLADVCKSLKITDSCTYYNIIGCKEAKATNNEYYYYMFVLNEGANQILKKNYKVAIDSINKALPKLIYLKNQGNVFASYFYYGKAYEGLGDSNQALINYKKVDSIFQSYPKIMTPEFTNGYLYLIKYYKKIGDKTNQLKYLTAYMAIDSTLQKNYKELNKLLQKEYDFPHLVKEKETLIESLSKKNRFYYWGITILIVMVVGLIIYQKQIKIKYQLKFEKIIQESNNIEINNIIPENTSININNEINIKSKEIVISSEIVNLILKKLENFENKKEFLNSHVSVQNLSEDFETNSKYLSKVVNEYKNKTFINYINDLRINYAIFNLQENKTARKYTLQALAIEYGFNTAESFSTAFTRKTGLKPSYFIKEIERKIC